MARVWILLAGALLSCSDGGAKADCPEPFRIGPDPVVLDMETRCEVASFEPDGEPGRWRSEQSFDRHGRSLQTTYDHDGDGVSDSVETNEYDSSGRLRRTSYERGSSYERTEFHYDSAGRLQRSVSYDAPEGGMVLHSATYSYVAEERVDIRFGPGDAGWGQQVYDSCGRIVRWEQEWHGHAYGNEYAYDDREVMIYWVEQDGRRGRLVRTNRFDETGVLVEDEGADGAVRRLEQGVPISYGPRDRPQMVQRVSETGWVLESRAADGAMYVSQRATCSPVRHPNVFSDLVPRH